ncbi:258d739b-6356-4995-8922-698f1a5f90e4 [Thermothielavioides terrestris]|uniref:258d739b-6356-4995-8922-698f1a5f90e4 n=1 Tax=Thermothielavioides terrestris TaxID=2587410 RepID=A0A3S4B9L3_9PEZI|nr:258d739b-6356-4995-8922-698f1a5f90e4 [Thermothielavioides terrestris]
MADIQNIWGAFGAKLPLILPTLVALLVVLLVQNVWSRRPLANIPVVGEELGGDQKRRQAYLSRAADLYLEGYKKFKDSVFRIVTPNKFTVVVVPPKYLSELRKLPDDVVSFDGAIEQSMHAKYTGILTGQSMIPHTIKTSLTPALVRLNPSIAEEVQHSIRQELPSCDDWTPVNINRKLLRIVALVSGRVFIGTELSRSEEYLDAAINYTVELMEARRALDAVRPWLRPLLGNRLPEVRRLNARIAQADRFLRPIVRARQQMREGDAPDDMLQWLLGSQDQFKQYTTEELARMQLGLTFAAIHTTTLTTTNVFYNLAAYPQYIPELRDEIRTVLAEHGGVFTSAALQAMKKVDSFLKETMRFTPAGAVSFQRKVTKSFTLSNGQVIPEGVVIEVPAAAASHDPDVFPDADKFDPWRFSRLREQARAAGEVEASALNQFVSVSPNILTFGFGRHACPGRFFAANEIKMIVANFVLNYDMALPEGVHERYKNLSFGSSSVPDPTKELLFKRIV